MLKMYLYLYFIGQSPLSANNGSHHIFKSLFLVQDDKFYSSNQVPEISYWVTKSRLSF